MSTKWLSFLPGSSDLLYISKHLGHTEREGLSFSNNPLLFHPAAGSFVCIPEHKIKSVYSTVYSHKNRVLSIICQEPNSELIPAELAEEVPTVTFSVTPDLPTFTVSIIIIIMCHCDQRF